MRAKEKRIASFDVFFSIYGSIGKKKNTRIAVTDHSCVLRIINRVQ